MNRAMMVAIAALAIAISSCGGGTETPASGGSPSDATPPPSPGCAPSGTELEIEAEDIAFDKDCLAVPAGVSFSVEVKNRDELVAHNFSIYTQAGDAVFTSETFQGPADRTLQVDPLEQGSYLFRCDVHPGTMNGTLIAGEEPIQPPYDPA